MGVGRLGEAGIGGRVGASVHACLLELLPGLCGLSTRHQRQAQSHQAAGQPHQQIIQPGSGGAQPAQPTPAITEHRIEGAGGLEGPGPGQRPWPRERPKAPQARPHQHPEQRGKQPIHRVLAGGFGGSPQDLAGFQSIGVAANDPAQPLPRQRQIRGRQCGEHRSHRLLQAAARQGAGQADQQGQGGGAEAAGDAMDRQALHPPARQSASTHQQQRDGQTSQTQTPGLIRRPGLRPATQPSDQPAHHHHRVQPAARVAEQAIQSTGQHHQQDRGNGGEHHRPGRRALIGPAASGESTQPPTRRPAAGSATGRSGRWPGPAPPSPGCPADHPDRRSD